MIGIVIYDDNIPRRNLLSELIALDPELHFLAGFDDCSNVVADMQTLQPDIVLMDIEMPKVNGIEGVRLIKEHYPQVKVIMQTVFDDDEKIFAAIQAGAEGYILKNTGADKLLQSIIEVYGGGAFMTPSVALKVMKFFNTGVANTSSDYHLTAKEQEVLNYLSNGLSYKMVAEKMNITYHTVNSHVKKIYQKLHVNSLGEAISLALKHKIVK